MKTKDARSFSSENSGRDPSEGGASCVGGEETCRGGQNLWGHAAHRRQMDEVVSNTRSSWSQCQAESRPRRKYPEGMASCADGTCDRRPLPGSVEVAVLPLDTGSGTGICRKALRHTTLLFGPSDDGWRSGVLLTKAATTCIRADPEAVEQWVKKIYPLLHARAKREHALM